jgi:hypothetical protein
MRLLSRLRFWMIFGIFRFRELTIVEGGGLKKLHLERWRIGF